MPEPAEPKKDMRLAALRRFATAITVLNVLGHTVLGFEQSLATPVTAVLVAYATEILLELVESWRLGRRPPFLGGGAVRVVDFLLSALTVGRGSFLNAVFPRRIPLILAWLGGFVLQAAIRHFAFGNLFFPSLNPMTGVAFLLFTFYMVTDPATTPVTRRGQIAFGLSM